MMDETQISAARDWLADCGYRQAYTCDRYNVARLVAREYEGGIEQFIADGEEYVPLDGTPVGTTKCFLSSFPTGHELAGWQHETGCKRASWTRDSDAWCGRY